jgi:hypothetical protein
MIRTPSGGAGLVCDFDTYFNGKLMILEFVSTEDYPRRARSSQREESFAGENYMAAEVKN